MKKLLRVTSIILIQAVLACDSSYAIVARPNNVWVTTLSPRIQLGLSSIQKAVGLRLNLNEEMPKGTYREPLKDKIIYELLNRVIKGETVCPEEIEIHPINLCNKRCQRCIGLTSKSFNKEMLSLEVMKGLLDQAKAYGIKRVKFSGYTGEPLLNSDCLSAIEYAVSLGLEVLLTTNGKLLDEKIRKVLVDGGVAVFISLDYFDRDVFAWKTGVTAEFYDVIINNVTELVSLRNQKKSKLKINLGIVLQPENYESEDEIMERVRSKKLFSTGINYTGAKKHIGTRSMIEKAKQLGVDSVRFRFDPGNTGNRISPEDVDKIIQNTKELISQLNNDDFSILFAPKLEHPHFGVCFAHYLLPVVGPTGDVYPCGHYSYALELRGRLGNIKNMSLEEIFESDRRKNLKNSGIPGEHCSTCPPYAYAINFVGAKLQHQVKIEVVEQAI